MTTNYILFVSVLLSTNIYAQLNIHLSYSTSFPDPLAHFQEKRMVPKEKAIAAKAAIVAAAFIPLEKAVTGYDDNLTKAGKPYTVIINRFAITCQSAIISQSLTSGIPGLSHLDVVNQVRNGIKLKTVKSIFKDHNDLMLPTNSMLDGERRLMSLKTIRLALKTTLIN